MNIIDKIKLFFKLKNAYEEVKQVELKKGFFTSEFLMAALTKVTAISCAIKGVAPWDLCLIATAVTDVIYMITRSWVKIRTAIKGPDVVVLPAAATTGPEVKPPTT